METEGAGEEGAGADETASEEAAGAAAAEAGEGSGDRTDDPEAATEDLGAGNPLAQKLSLGFCFFRFSFLGFLIDFPPFFVLQTHLRLSQWRQRAPAKKVSVLM